MSTLSPDQGQQVSPYLDQALGLRDEEREACVASLPAQNPAMAGLLQTLLDEHHRLAREGFLEQGPVPLPSPAVLTGQTIGVGFRFPAATIPAGRLANRASFSIE